MGLTGAKRSIHPSEIAQGKTAMMEWLENEENGKHDAKGCPCLEGGLCECSLRAVGIRALVDELKATQAALASAMAQVIRMENERSF